MSQSSLRTTTSPAAWLVPEIVHAPFLVRLRAELVVVAAGFLLAVDAGVLLTAGEGDGVAISAPIGLGASLCLLAVGALVRWRNPRVASWILMTAVTGGTIAASLQVNGVAALHSPWTVALPVLGYLLGGRWLAGTVLLAFAVPILASLAWIDVLRHGQGEIANGVAVISTLAAAAAAVLIIGVWDHAYRAERRRAEDAHGELRSLLDATSEAVLEVKPRHFVPHNVAARWLLATPGLEEALRQALASRPTLAGPHGAGPIRIELGVETVHLMAELRTSPTGRRWLFLRDVSDLVAAAAPPPLEAPVG